jgi:hypothetical protein
MSQRQREKLVFFCVLGMAFHRNPPFTPALWLRLRNRTGHNRREGAPP